MQDILAPEDLVQNLKDTGMPAEDIARFLTCRAAQDLQAALRILARQRDSLLDQVHAGEKKIDCLDYLVYRLQREAGPTATHQEANTQ